MKLGDAATVRSGLVLSRKQAREPSKMRYRALNLRSINPEGYIDTESLDVFEASEQLSPEYLSQSGDVIVRMSAPYTAVLIDDNTAGIVISSNFVVIRCNKREIIPEYLFWLINTPEAKKKVYENATSNMLATVKAKYFTDYEIVPMPIADQRQIAAMNTLAKKEARLLRQLADEKEKIYEQAIQRAYQKLKRGK